MGAQYNLHMDPIWKPTFFGTSCLKRRVWKYVAVIITETGRRKLKISRDWTCPSLSGSVKHILRIKWRSGPSRRVRGRGTGLRARKNFVFGLKTIGLKPEKSTKLEFLCYDAWNECDDTTAVTGRPHLLLNAVAAALEIFTRLHLYVYYVGKPRHYQRFVFLSAECESASTAPHPSLCHGHSWGFSLFQWIP